MPIQPPTPASRSCKAADDARLRAGALALILSASTLVAYAPALDAGFVWDDDDYVTENPLLHAPDGLRRIWFSMDAPSQYVPLVYTTLRFEYGLWGLDASGYHLTNILLHATNALLLFWLLSRMGVPGAWLGAALFAVHPVHVESVAWISERKNVLMLLLSLCSALAWLRHLEREGEGARRSYWMSVGLHVLALTAKATACTQPAALLLIAWLREGRLSRRRLIEMAPFLVSGLMMGLTIMVWERFHIGTQGERFDLTFLESLLVATRAVWFYLWKLLWPFDLAFSYPRFEVDPTDPLHYLPMFAGLALLWTLFGLRNRIDTAPLAVALYYVAMLGPMLGFIPLFTFWYTFVADHYQYAASIGPIALFAAALATASRRSRATRYGFHGVTALLLLGLGTLTWQQSRVYESKETLWRDTIAKNPSSWMAHANLGRHFNDEGRHAEAAEAHRRALELRPESYRSHVGAARALTRLQRFDEAKVHYQAALEINPELTGAHAALARLAWRRGDGEAAVEHRKAVVSLRPDSARAHLRLAETLERLGRVSEARASRRRAAAIEARPEQLRTDR
jgi:tetratricopeptide (TPR) repeat protein